MSPWKHPDPQSTRLDAFRRHVNQKYSLSLSNYAQLHQWSVRELEAFCRETWIFCGLTHSVPPIKVANGIDVMWPRPEWFPGARLNYTENLLATGLAAHPDATAVSAGRERADDQWRHLTWRQLSDQVAHYATALKSLGVKTGDVVASVMTNSIEAVIILLAAAAIGAISSSTAPDMGLTGIIERYGQVQPKLLFVESEVVYGGKKLDLRPKLRALSQHLKNDTSKLERVIVVFGRVWDDHHVMPVSEFLNVKPSPLAYVQLPFDHPVYILYSSGTTGSPKCICHSAGGALLQQKKDFILSFNMGLESSYYQFTTTGWMMWNYLVGALSVGTRIVLYDGSPLYPSPGAQVKIIQKQGVTHWGTSPKFLAALKQSGLATDINLPNLELTISAGSPLSEDISSWFSRTFPHRIGLLSGSGGTDLVASIVGGTMLSTVHDGEIAAPMLGMAVEIWDDNGKNIDDSGEKGDLVITKPFFSMPVTFWGKDGMAKYEKAYFKTFPGVWCHGDFILKNPETGGFVILGRSDGVLNPQGVRFGTAELYGIVDTFPEVLDCIAVGQRRHGESDEHVLMFLKLRDARLDGSLCTRIRQAIKTQLSARHVPAHILQVTDVPYTMNGKKIENLVRDVVNGREIKDTGVISNPECLPEYHKFVSLSGVTGEQPKPRL